MSEAKETIAGIFGRAAEVYDEVEPRMFAHFGLRLVELADLSPRARVLDVATGKGAVLFPAADRAAEVVGVDLAGPMVEATRARIAAAGLANARVEVMDAEALAFADGSFDAVLCGFALFFLDDPDAALRAWQRVLRPGGLVAASTFDRGDPRWDAVRERMRRGARAGGKPWRPARRFETADDLRAALTDAGLQDVRIVTDVFDAAYDDPEHWLAWAWTHGQRGMLERLGADELAAFEAEVFPTLEATREPDGRLHNRITAALGYARTPTHAP